ncbi:hypothetical protein F5X68DRAFT_260385 [Plectosphaerella plurivora]|uniref:Ankyrin repeat protein n=1 Tax=Plectosphaerella plurivora TaxID=936078 RepID=A0A9P8VF91_9PEZI|nr:hypothetical protein F5X68DRAFT_260385 [Plectosphaerella plurivora]
MDTDPVCFEQAWYSMRNDQITLDGLVDLIVQHFNGIRHPEDEKLDDASVRESARRDLVEASAKVCMADPTCHLPAAQLRTILLVCIKEATVNAEDLKDIDGDSASILTSPAAVQLLVALCITAKKKELAKSLIASLPSPPPRSHLIFDAPGHGYPYCLTAHSALQYHKDNACDVWLQLLDADWALADVRMFRWATSSPVSADAVGLVGALVERGLHPDREIAEHALSSGPMDLIPVILESYKPSDIRDEHKILKAAAVRKSPEEAIAAFKLLFSRGISDINWIDSNTHVEYISRNWPLYDPRGICEMSYSWSPEQTVLHTAIMGGHINTIEWLIGQGATNQVDGWWRDAYNTAIFNDRPEVVELLSKLGVEGSPKLTKFELWDPRRTVDQARELWRAREKPQEEKEGCVFL